MQKNNKLAIIFGLFFELGKLVHIVGKTDSEGRVLASGLSPKTTLPPGKIRIVGEDPIPKRALK